MTVLSINTFWGKYLRFGQSSLKDIVFEKLKFELLITQTHGYRETIHTVSHWAFCLSFSNLANSRRSFKIKR